MSFYSRMSATIGIERDGGTTGRLGRVGLAGPIVVAALISGQPSVAQAELARPLALDAPEVRPESTDARVRAIDRRLASEEHRFVSWRWGWMLAYGGLFAGNLLLVPRVSRADRIDYYTGAVTSGIGVAALALQPTQPSLSGAGGDCPADGGLRAACVEQRYREVSGFQRSARGWLAHTINLVFNAAVSAFLGLGYDRWRSAAANLVVGTAIGEVQIATQPHGALEELR